MTADEQQRTDPPPIAGTATEEDMRLVARLASGDEAAFTMLVEQYHAVLVRLALSFVSSQPVAEEVAQETWIGVLNGLRRFEGRSSLKTWIFRILTNQAKTRGVRERRSLPFSAFEGPEGGEPAVEALRFGADGHWTAPPRPWEENTPEQLTLSRETRAHVQEAIEALPPNQRSVITLRDVEGWPAAEVCNVLGLSETNQRVLLHRARARVRRALERYLDET